MKIQTFDNGRLVSVEDMADTTSAPLDATGALATLFATKGILTTEEAADAIGRQPSELVAEAEAWAVAADLASKR